MIDHDTVHIYPVNDLHEHIIDSEEGECPCHPDVEAIFREDGSNGWMVTHNAWDGRE